jgi:hypothetical protein
MEAVVINISAWAFPLKETRQAIVTTAAVPIKFARMAILLPCNL